MEEIPELIATQPIQSKHALWQERIGAWQRSGLSQKAWCEREQIALSSLGYWRKRLRAAVGSDAGPDQKPRLIPVALTESSSAMTIRLGHTLTIDIAPDIDRALLKDLLTVLRTPV